MANALVCSGQLSLSAWEPAVPSRATKAQSVERRWQQFLVNVQIRVSTLYVPLVLVALSGWKPDRLYLALDTTVVWAATAWFTDPSCAVDEQSHCCGGS